MCASECGCVGVGECVLVREVVFGFGLKFYSYSCCLFSLVWFDSCAAAQKRRKKLKEKKSVNNEEDC